MTIRVRAYCACCVFILLLASASSAQTNNGQISGTVRDTSGGVLPGVTVTVTNVNTNISRTEVTGANGTYLVTNLPFGPYKVSVELQGFRKAEKTGIQLPPDGRITADFGLNVGSMTETIDVVAVRGETVNRTSGEISRTIDGDQVRELALSGRNYLELASLIPGAVQIDDDQMALTTSLGTGGTIINGSRGNTNSLMVDGGFNLDSGSNASQINNVGLNFIDQVKIQTSNFSAEYGRNSGAAINVVTKSGTNKLRGSAFNMFRDEKFDATNVFAPRMRTASDQGPARFQGCRVRARAVRSRRASCSSSAAPNTSGSIAWMDHSGGRCRRRRSSAGIFSARAINDPLTGQPVSGNIIPADRITTDGRAIANVYLAMIDRALQFADTPTANNATYQLDFPYRSREDIVRLDYRVNDANRIYLRFLHDMYELD